jgi:hypothetical protein
MQQRRRYPIQFEALEAKVLLSTTAVDPAAAAHVAVKPAKAFVLDTKPYVYVFVTARHLRDNSYFQARLDFGHRKQPVGSIGKADMLAQLVGEIRRANELPDLGGATMTFSNAKGTVVLSVATSNTTTYRFSIVSATGKFASAVGGTGSMTIGLNHRRPPSTPQYILTLRSNRF